MYTSTPAKAPSPAIATTTSSTSSAVSSPAVSSPAVPPVRAATSSCEIPPIVAAPVAIAAAPAATAIPIGFALSRATAPSVSQEAIAKRAQAVEKMIDAMPSTVHLENASKQISTLTLYGGGYFLNPESLGYHHVVADDGRSRFNLVTEIHNLYGSVSLLLGTPLPAGVTMTEVKEALKEKFSSVITHPAIWQLKDKVPEACEALNKALEEMLAADKLIRDSSKPSDSATTAAVLSTHQHNVWYTAQMAYLCETCRHLCEDPINDAAFLVHTEHLTIEHTLNKFLSETNKVDCALLVEQDEKAHTESGYSTTSTPPRRLLPLRFTEPAGENGFSMTRGYRLLMQ